MKILLSYILSFILFAQIILGQGLENYKDEKLDKKTPQKVKFLKSIWPL